MNIVLHYPCTPPTLFGVSCRDIVFSSFIALSSFISCVYLVNFLHCIQFSSVQSIFFSAFDFLHCIHLFLYFQDVVSFTQLIYPFIFSMPFALFLSIMPSTSFMPFCHSFHSFRSCQSCHSCYSVIQSIPLLNSVHSFA